MAQRGSHVTVRRRRGRLSPGELAEAVVLADLSLALNIVGHVVPFGSILVIAAVVPLAVVATRHRLRAVIAGAVAASVVGFLVIGIPALTTTAGCAAFGALVGAADRRGWSRRRTIATGVAVLWPPIAAVVDLLLFAFSDLRKLTLDQIRNGWHGLFHLLENVGLDGVASSGDRAVDWIVRNWWVSIPIGLLGPIVLGIWLSQGLAAPALRRVRSAFTTSVPEAPPADDLTHTPQPLPVILEDVTFRYPGASEDALRGLSLRVDPAELVAIGGRNGSGKSTLARILAARRMPASGRVERPGPAGLGRPGGTALVFQRPEAQVLGVRVGDDIVWGLPDATHVDVRAALARVGLQELADRETSTLSGGELQRLAIAAALVRTPRLFVSDESTAMVDAEGRTRLVALLRDLARDGVGVVHVTHLPNESEGADRTVVLDAGRIVEKSPAARTRQRLPARPRPPALGAPVIELRGVGHVYSRGTPWAKRALEGIDLTVHERESALIVGHNGSGKSTLAWIMGGLILPSEGDARVDAGGGGFAPIAEHVGRVGVAFQHARLQLLRPTVLDEVKVAAGVDDRDARAALAAVGLDAAIGPRRIDELSGGQMRRVVLAEVLAARSRAVVLDEPFAGLDLEGRADLEAVLVRMRDEVGIPLVIVSHDRDLPDALLERVVELEAGRIVRDERVDDVEAKT
jgi:energy-coupling factor transport system ATP-binding protein